MRSFLQWLTGQPCTCITTLHIERDRLQREVTRLTAELAVARRLNQFVAKSQERVRAS